MNFLRTVKKLIINSNLNIKYNRWKIENEQIEDQVQVLFIDGMIAFDSSAKALISKVQADNYALMVKDGKGIIDKYSLKDKDIFLGRDENYLLFREGNLDFKSKNIVLNCEQFNINCDALNIESPNININTDSIILNGVEITIVGNKVILNGKEIAVIGGQVNLTSGDIIVSGQ